MIDYISIMDKMQDSHSRGLLVAASFERLGLLRQAAAIRDCGTFVEVTTTMTPEGKPISGVTAANFCRERLCPSCMWRRSLKIYSTTSRILNYVDEHWPGGQKFLFLTLTVENCKPEDLSETLDMMAAGMKRLLNNRAFERRVLGSMRTLEITINHEKGTLHPHYHMILAVPPNYARRSSGLYLTQEEWQEMWAKSARLSYDPILHIEAVKGTREKQVAEVAKYLCKSDNLTAGDTAEQDKWIQCLHTHMQGRRLVAYSGRLREAQKALKLSNPESGALTETIRGDVATVIRRFGWSAGLGTYQQTSVKKFSGPRPDAHEEKLRREAQSGPPMPIMDMPIARKRGKNG